MQTAGPGDVAVGDNTLQFSNGDDSDYTICVCDVPFPDTGVHTISVNVREKGACAGIGVVSSFENVVESHDNGSIVSSPSGTNTS